MNNNPILYINNVKYLAVKPKAKVWFDIMTIDEKLKSRPVKDLLKVYAEIIAEVFPEVTAAEIIDSLDIDEIRPKFIEVEHWVISLINNKAEEYEKNVQSPDAE